MTRPSATLAAFLVACLGITLFSLMDATMKGLSLALGAYAALFWRQVAGALLTSALWLAGGPRWPAWAVLRLHLWRGAIVAVMALLFFWSVTLLPLAEAIALSFVAPLIALYLAAALLGETIGRGAIVGSALGLAGVATIMAARLGGHHDARAATGVAAVLGSAVLYAYNLVLARQQAQAASMREIGFFQTATVLACLIPAAPWWLERPPVALIPALALAAVLAVSALLLQSWAYARAEAQVLIPVEYTAFIWAAICGWVFFHEPLTWPLLGGTLLIVAGCLIAARGSHRAEPIEAAVA